MKHKKGRPLLITSMILCVSLILCAPLAISYFYLPSEIRIIAGEEHLFNFDIPLKANILKGEGVFIKDRNDSLIQNQSIDLNKPLYVMMTDEGRADVTLSFLGIIPLKTVSVEAIPYEELIPCGEVAGIKINTTGILVLGIGEFEAEHKQVSPCKGIIEVGDLIMSCNGVALESKEDLRTCIESSEEASLKLKIIRQGKQKEVTVQPVYSSSENEYKIGVWIKDSTQGIGTITYIHPDNGGFGALGHGITDGDTHRLIPVKGGEIMEARITHIKKGEKGEPGEVSGVINYSDESYLGDIHTNNALGIYGTVDQTVIRRQSYSAMPIAFQDEVHEGKASILVDLTGNGAQEYEVSIQKVSKYSNEPSKGMVIKIVDEELLALTGGIVQGMSGSPILQDGKLIGAITHVFIQDPTRGYGIFIENMINNEKR